MGFFKTAFTTTAALLTLTSAFADGSADYRRNPNRGGYGPGYGNGGPGYGRGNDYGRGGYQQSQRIVLRMRDQQFQGQSIIALKREIMQQTGQRNLQNMQLKSVTLIAKSRHGRGQATLLVGGQQSYSQTVQGNPYDFHSREPFTYDRVTFFSPGYSSQGKWQIKLQGNFKVKRVVVEVVGINQHQTVNLWVQDHFRGQNTLKLKQLIKQQTQLMPRDFEIVSVKMKAKSKHGQGRATLSVGNYTSMPYLIYGTPRNFHNPSFYTFQDVTLNSPGFGTQGPWQVHLQGNIKVSNLQVVLKQK